MAQKGAFAFCYDGPAIVAQVRLGNRENITVLPEISCLPPISAHRRWHAIRWQGWLYGLLAVFALGNLVQIPVFAAEGRHALLIGIGRYAPASGATSLDGVPFDLKSARLMAKAMGVDDAAIVELRDDQATKANIEARLEQMSRKVVQGDRVFVYFSGHGTRISTTDGCEEGLFTFEGDMINVQELAKFTGPMSQRAEKIITMVDACFSGGVVSPTRSLAAPPGLVAKFISKDTQGLCSIQGANNLTTRSLLSELARFGIKSENFVQIAAARRDEVSWDEPGKGGVATQAISRCLMGEAQDLNRSGAISLEEVRACAQKIVDERMAPHRRGGQLPSTIQVSGNRNLVVVPVALNKPLVVQAVIEPPSPLVAPNVVIPAPIVIVPPVVVVAPPVNAPPPVFSQPQPVPPQPVLPLDQPVALVTVTPPVIQAPPVIQTPPDRPQPVLPLVQPVALAPVLPVIQAPPVQPQLVVPEPVGALATMHEIYHQRDPRRELAVLVPDKPLRIGVDKLSLTVKSATAGYVYAVMLGSDEKSFYLLFPNKIDKDNRIKANQTMRLPRPAWDITAGGPEGTNRLLVVVSQSPRDAKIFVPGDGGGGGAFTFAVADLPSRGRLIDFFVGKGVKGRSAAMSAALIDIKEIP